MLFPLLAYSRSERDFSEAESDSDLSVESDDELASADAERQELPSALLPPEEFMRQLGLPSTLAAADRFELPSQFPPLTTWDTFRVLRSSPPSSPTSSSVCTTEGTDKFADSSSDDDDLAGGCIWT